MKSSVFGLRNGWRLYLAILTPLACLPLALLQDGVIVEDDGTTRPATKYKTAYVILVMSIYWLFEVVALPVTALLPILFFPLLGIRAAYYVTQTYAQESNMIFLTGAIIALGLEYCNLHRRIALKAMIIFGSSPTRLLFGIMIITGFLSMWMSSATCVSMLVPIVIAIIDEIHDSPEVMTSKRLTRIGRLSAALPDQNPISILRRLSSVSANAHTNSSYPNSRKESSVFENPTLVRSGGAMKKPTVDLGRRYTLHQIPSINPFPVQIESLGYTDLPKPKQFAKVKAQLQDEGTSRHNTHHPTPSTMMTTTTTTRSPYESHAHALRDIESGSLSELRKVSTPHLPEIELISPEEVMKEEAAIDKRRNEIKKLFLFAMAYAANIGGTAILTTAGPNKILKENLKHINVDQDGKYKKVSFYSWFILNFPVMIINLFFAWIYLSLQYNGFIRSIFRRRKSEDDDDCPMDKDVYTWKTKLVNALLRSEYQKLGKICFHQVAVGLVFVLVVMLWIFREAGDTVSWGEKISDSSSTGDSTAAMVGVMLLFIIPKDWTFFKDGTKKYEPLLDWKFVASKMPWGGLLLLGSGFAIADAVNYSGLSDAMGRRLLNFGEEFSNTFLLLAVIVFATSITEITSNVASAVIIIPIVLSLSESLGLHPLYLSIPTTVACSYSFMLPGAAPSNAMVFAAGNFKMHEMVKNGFFMKILCIGVLFGITATYGEYLFHFSDYEYPESESSTGASHFSTQQHAL